VLSHCIGRKAVVVKGAWYLLAVSSMTPSLMLLPNASQNLRYSALSSFCTFFHICSTLS
jgi:hypothetical protein